MLKKVSDAPYVLDDSVMSYFIMFDVGPCKFIITLSTCTSVELHAGSLPAIAGCDYSGKRGLVTKPT